MRISDWSSDVCSSDLGYRPDLQRRDPLGGRAALRPDLGSALLTGDPPALPCPGRDAPRGRQAPRHLARRRAVRRPLRQARQLPERAEGLRPRGRAVQALPRSDRQGSLLEPAGLLLRGLPGLRARAGPTALAWT